MKLNRHHLIVLFILILPKSLYAIAPFETIELTFAGSSQANPYWEVDFSAPFQGPGGQKISVPGFWDGDTSWKIRFSPLSIGLWHYRTNSNDPKLDNQTGQVLCSGEPKRGWLKRGDTSERTFIWSGSQEPYLLFGDCWWGHLSSGTTAERFPHAKFREVVDLWSAAGYSCACCMLSSWFPEFTDWFNEGGKPWHVVGGRFDLTRPNPGYFQEVDRRIAYANQKGICVCICLTES